MKNINLPAQIIEVLNMLEKANYEGYIVGGAIRDCFLGKEPKDYDIATNATVEELCDLFNEFKVIKTGLKHGTITLLINDLNIEVTTYRDANKTLKGDLLLRDFTINALAYSIKDGVIDYYNGIDDIKNKIIRINGHDDGRFLEDPLRLLRAIRLSAILQFDIENNTKNYIFQDARLLNDVSKERISDEFTKILLSVRPSNYIREYFDVFTIIMPELAPLKGFDQNNPWHIYDCLEHTLMVVDNVNNDIVMRLAALFHDSGKPHTYTEDENHVGHFYDHYKISMDISKKVLRRLKYSNDIIERVVHLINYHDYPLTLTTKSLKKLLNYFGEKDIYNLLTLKRADNLAQNPKYYSRMLNIDEAEKMINEIIKNQDCFSLDNLKVSGKDLILIGITNGQDIGYILKQLLDLVVRDEISNSHDVLLSKAKEIIRNRGEL